MNNLIDLYEYAAHRGIGVFWFSLDSVESLSYMDSDGDCFIAMEPWHIATLAEEKVKLGHELGHCETGSFYNEHATLDMRKKHEIRANRWAYKKLVPEDELLEAITKGYREPWELAEYFDVTESFLRDALDYYHMQTGA